MKYFKKILQFKDPIFLILFIFIASILHINKANFPCINSDEASFAYNAYSIANTAKDEYGSFLPMRFLAFGENKLPITIYSIVPFIKIFGMNDISIRLPFILLGIISPILMYFLLRRIFNNNSIGLIGAFLISISPWVQILSRHVHEDTIMLIIAILSLLCLADLHKKISTKRIIALSVLLFLGLFTYHIGKYLAVFSIIWLIYIFFKQKISQINAIKYFLIILLPIAIFWFSEYTNPSTRLGNLFFLNDRGFILQIEELRKEHDVKIIHNKLTHAISTLSNQYFSYFSHDFLVAKGDGNLRFGIPGISPITTIEYVFLFVGLYYLFKNKENNRYLILSFLLTAPVTAALSWQTQSLTRSYLMVIPLVGLSSYGFYQSIIRISSKFRALFFFAIVIIFSFSASMTWDYYFNHYFNKRNVVSAWQCGYKELSNFISQNYNNYEQFNITNKLGQPYIFLLYNQKTNPEIYQKQARLSKIDEYGFGQVKKYDKFNFSFSKPFDNAKALYIGLPEEFDNSYTTDINLKKISTQGYDIFWIYSIN